VIATEREEFPLLTELLCSRRHDEGQPAVGPARKDGHFFDDNQCRNSSAGPEPHRSWFRKTVAGLSLVELEPLCRHSTQSSGPRQPPGIRFSVRLSPPTRERADNDNGPCPP